MLTGILACLIVARTAEESALIVGAVLIPLAVVLLDVVVLILARRPILRAKTEEGWYDGLRVGTATPLFASKRRFSRGAIAAFGVTVAILVVVTVVGIVRWPQLPDPIPTHFDANGNVDGWAAKSVWSVFGLHLILTATAVLMVVLGLLIPSRRQHPDGQADLGRAEARGRTGVVVATLAVCALLMALVDAGLSSAIWWAAETATVQAITASTVIASLAVCILPLVLAARMRREIATGEPGDTETPDDDAHWKLGGQVYLNRADPSVWVPKRVGIGYTVNVATPAGVAVTVVIGLVLVGCIVVGILAITRAIS